MIYERPLVTLVSSPSRNLSLQTSSSYGNLTNKPRALIGFLLSLSLLSCDRIGRAGGNSAAGIGTYFFFGGLLMILGGVSEVCDLMETYQSTHIYTILIPPSITHICIRYCSFKLTFSDPLWVMT